MTPPNDAKAPDASGGSPPTMEELYRRYAGWLKRTLTRRFDPQQAEDLTQEAYIGLRRYQAAGEIRHPKSLLLRIAENLAYNQLRGARRDQRRRERLSEASGCHAPYTEAEQTEALLFKQVVSALPEPLRDTFMLSRYGGLTYAEIALRSGVSVKTVEWRITKALALIAKQLRD